MTIEQRLIIRNCLQSGMNVAEIFESCFASDCSVITIKYLKQIAKMTEDDWISYIYDSNKRGPKLQNHDAFDTIVSILVKKYPGMPQSFIQLQVQPYLDVDDPMLGRERFRLSLERLRAKNKSLKYASNLVEQEEVERHLIDMGPFSDWLLGPNMCISI